MTFLIDFSSLYVSQVEWRQLAAETCAVSAHQTVKLLNCRTSLQANSTDISTATQRNQLCINYTEGFEDYLTKIVVKNTGSATQPALVTNI